MKIQLISGEFIMILTAIKALPHRGRLMTNNAFFFVIFSLPLGVPIIKDSNHPLAPSPGGIPRVLPKTLIVFFIPLPAGNNKKMHHDLYYDLRIAAKRRLMTNNALFSVIFSLPLVVPLFIWGNSLKGVVGEEWFPRL